MPSNYERTNHSSMSMTQRFIQDVSPLHLCTRGPVQDAIRWMFNFKRTITVLLLVCCATTISILLVDFQQQPHPNLLVVIRQIPSHTDTSHSIVGNNTNVGASNATNSRNIDAMMNTLLEEEQQEQETDSRQTSSNTTITNRTEDTRNQLTNYSKFLAHSHEISSPIVVPTVIDWFRNNRTVSNTNATHEEENWNGEESLLLLLNQSSDSENIDASPSFLRTEVQSILHYPEESKIVVNFVNSTGRRCLRPRIFGRLSGEYLAMVRWDHDVRGKLSQRGDSAGSIDNRTQKVDVITGYYNLPAKGRYFIEIIGLLCNDFSFDENFNPTCLEDPVTNHLTAPGSFIDVYNISLINDDPEKKETERCWEVVGSPPATGSQNNVIASIGFWKWAKRDEKAIPLSTRYQGQNCRGSNEERCMVSGSLDRFQPYEFQWSCSEQLSPVDFDQVTNGGNLTLCAVGNSHSRELVTHLNYWRGMYNLTNVNMVWVPLSYPHEMRWNWQTRKALGCDLAIVGLGQWPAGKKPRNPNAPATILPQYMNDLNSGVQRWRQYGIKLALRKIHYNPLGDLITQCPPLDHRSPPVIDGYNEIVQYVAKKYNVTFIDTSDVMDVMWDSAEDYCHYKGLQGRTEALLILHEALKNERILHDREPSRNAKRVG